MSNVPEDQYLEAPARRRGDDPPSALDRVAQTWVRCGYWVTYRDEYLVQLAGRTLPNRVVLELAALTGVLLVALGTSLVVRWRRPWTVVTLAVSPEGSIVTHRLRTRRLPER
jgi:hypothetical protein